MAEIENSKGLILAEKEKLEHRMLDAEAKKGE